MAWLSGHTVAVSDTVPCFHTVDAGPYLGPPSTAWSLHIGRAMATEFIERAHGVNLALLAIAVGAVLSLPRGMTRATGEEPDAADELECEEAVARLVKCCPDLQPSTVNCDYRVEEGCDTSCTYYPDIGPSEGKRIRSLSCAEVAAEGICSRVAGEDRYQCSGMY